MYRWARRILHRVPRISAYVTYRRRQAGTRRHKYCNNALLKTLLRKRTTRTANQYTQPSNTITPRTSRQSVNALTCCRHRRRLSASSWRRWLASAQLSSWRRCRRWSRSVMMTSRRRCHRSRRVLTSRRSHCAQENNSSTCTPNLNRCVMIRQVMTQQIIL